MPKGLVMACFTLFAAYAAMQNYANLIGYTILLKIASVILLAWENNALF